MPDMIRRQRTKKERGEGKGRGGRKGRGEGKGRGGR